MEERDKKVETEKKTERRPLPRVQTQVKAGPARRTENFGDPIGNYNFSATTS
jgi:hypothetical protein